MNNWYICCFFTHIFNGDFNFKGLIARRLYKSFGVKGKSQAVETNISSRSTGITVGICSSFLSIYVRTKIVSDKIFWGKMNNQRAFNTV
jgi:hypothetical protein